MPRLTPEERKRLNRQRNGRKGALTTLANSPDWSALTAPARQAFRDRFARQVDPDGTMDPVERTKRAEVARRLYYHDLADRSRKARAARLKAKEAEPAAAAAG